LCFPPPPTPQVCRFIEFWKHRGYKFSPFLMTPPLETGWIRVYIYIPPRHNVLVTQLWFFAPFPTSPRSLAVGFPRPLMDQHGKILFRTVNQLLVSPTILEPAFPPNLLLYIETPLAFLQNCFSFLRPPLDSSYAN